MTLRVCFITDDKPGHKNQLIGLEQSLKLQSNIVSQWLTVEEMSVSWFDVLRRRMEFSANLIPDMVVGAGSATHKLVLAMKRKYGCFSVVLMKPSVVPLSWFDATIIPEHDSPPNLSNVFVTKGVLNKIRPKRVDQCFPRNGLIMVGGESKHYKWDSNYVWKQIEILISKNSNGISQWVLGDSRRTPDDFKELFPEHLVSKIVYVGFKDVPSNWLPEQMSVSDQIWVTPDSVSMVYEALTSGALVGLFKLEDVKYGRIAQGVQHLQDEGLVSTLENLLINHSDKVFCEADEVVIWLLERFRVWSENV